MKDEYYFCIYLAVGAVGTLVLMWLEHRGSCPTRGDALTQFLLGTFLGPAAVAFAVLVSPIWVPCMLYCEVYEGSKLDRAITAWFKKPICKKS